MTAKGSEAGIASGFVNLSAVRAVIGRVSKYGLSQDELLERSGLDPKDDEHTAVPMDAFVHLVKLVIRETHDEAFGLFPHPVKFGAFHFAGRIAVDCLNLSQAMERFAELYNLLGCGVSFSVRSSGDELSIELNEVDASSRIDVIAYELHLLSFYRLFSWLVGHSLLPGKFSLRAAECRLCDTGHSSFSDVSVINGADYNSIAFSKLSAALRVVRTEKDFNSFSQKHAAYLFEPLRTSGEFTLRTRLVVNDHFDVTGKFPQLRDIEDGLGVSARTIRMQLKAEGVRFRDLVTTVRRDHSIKAIADTSRSLQDVAELAGYSELSAFSRAFKTWTGKAPLDYRRRLVSV